MLSPRDQRVLDEHNQDRQVGQAQSADRAAEMIANTRNDQIDYAIEQFRALGMSDEEIAKELADL